jgi:hypothetical protein
MKLWRALEKEEEPCTRELVHDKRNLIRQKRLNQIKRDAEKAFRIRRESKNSVEGETSKKVDSQEDDSKNQQ